MSRMPRIFLLMVYLGILLQGCSRDVPTDRYTRRNYAGRWNLVSLTHSYSSNGGADSSHTYLGAGYLVLEIDETFADNPVFISAELAESMEMLDALQANDVLEIVTNASERRAYWAVDADERRLTIWGKDNAGSRFVAISDLEKTKKGMTLTYTEQGGPDNADLMQEKLVLEKE